MLLAILPFPNILKVMDERLMEIRISATHYLVDPRTIIISSITPEVRKLPCTRHEMDFILSCHSNVLSIICPPNALYFSQYLFFPLFSLRLTDFVRVCNVTNPYTALSSTFHIIILYHQKIFPNRWWCRSKGLLSLSACLSCPQHSSLLPSIHRTG